MEEQDRPEGRFNKGKLMPGGGLERAYTPSFELFRAESLILENSGLGAISQSVKSCLRCGKCIEVCPMHLMPVLMYQATQDGDVDGMKSVNLLDCIECGCCAYTCPASVPLVLGFRAGKQMIRNVAAREKAKA